MKDPHDATCIRCRQHFKLAWSVSRYYLRSRLREDWDPGILFESWNGAQWQEHWKPPHTFPYYQGHPTPQEVDAWARKLTENSANTYLFLYQVPQGKGFSYLALRILRELGYKFGEFKFIDGDGVWSWKTTYKTGTRTIYDHILEEDVL